MSALMQKEERAIGNILDWRAWPLSPPSLFTGDQMRIEDYVENGEYIVRAELPDVEPEEDIDVEVAHGRLTITAERRKKARARQTAEFRYGTLSRSIALPSDADEQRVRAISDNGILEVTMALTGRQAPSEHRRVPVMIDKHIKLS